MRQAGCLIPVFSIRSATGWGLGEIPDLVPFARWAADAGMSVVQVLPVHQIGRGETSPYSALSAFAIDPVYVALDAVEDFQAAGGEDALSPAQREELAALRRAPAVPWARSRALKTAALELAFRSFLDEQWRRGGPRAKRLEAYAAAEASWLDDYALFTALHDARDGQPWTAWEAPLRDRDPAALAEARERHAEAILYHRWVQWLLDSQWHAARKACNAAGVELMGDLPFMTAADSADVWSRPDDFRLDARVGVPPDQYSAVGQDWGLPVFRWAEMAERGYEFIRARARRTASLYGLFRVDHVVGLYRTYFRTGAPTSEGEFVPADEAAQTRNGEATLRIFAEGAQVIAEDLGVVPDFVRASLARLGIPGYRVMRWEKEWKQAGQPFRDPARWPALSVGTTGTHDTDSVADWYDALPAAERAQLLELPGLEALAAHPPGKFDDAVRDALLSVIYGSGSDLLLVPFQDLMGARERVNVPGLVSDENWTYRMPMTLQELANDLGTTARLRRFAAGSGRLGGLDR